MKRNLIILFFMFSLLNMHVLASENINDITSSLGIISEQKEIKKYMA